MSGKSAVNRRRRGPGYYVVAGGLVLMAMAVGSVLWRVLWVRPPNAFPILRDVPSKALPPVTDKIRPALRRWMDEARAGRGASVRFVVDLVEQPDFVAFGAVMDHRGLREDKAARRAAMLEALRLLKADRQAAIAERLRALRDEGRVERFDGFRIVQRIAVVARDPAVLIELAGRADVRELIEDVSPPEPGAAGQAPGTIELRAPPSGPVAPRSWAIDAVHAEAAWKQGLDGRGVVVGLLDTGARRAHDQLRDNWRGAREPALATRSWYDPTDGEGREPVDVSSSGHGTGVLAAAVGMNRPFADGRPVAVGVAPGATWVAALAYPEGRHDRVAFTAAADWMLFEGRPDVLIHTFAYRDEEAEPLAHHLFSAFKATETVVVFAAGNSGPSPASNVPPANLLKIYPFDDWALSVGATGKNGRVASFSARGPNSRNFSELFPMMVAPGDELTVAYPLAPDALIANLGTSYSAGYVAGAAAILLQRSPSLRPNEVEQILMRSARPIGPQAPNNEAGWGELDIEAALHGLEAQIERRKLGGDGGMTR